MLVVSLSPSRDELVARLVAPLFSQRASHSWHPPRSLPRDRGLETLGQILSTGPGDRRETNASPDSSTPARPVVSCQVPDALSVSSVSGLLPVAARGRPARAGWRSEEARGGSSDCRGSMTSLFARVIHFFDSAGGLACQIALNAHNFRLRHSRSNESRAYTSRQTLDPKGPITQRKKSQRASSSTRFHAPPRVPPISSMPLRSNDGVSAGFPRLLLDSDTVVRATRVAPRYSAVAAAASNGAAPRRGPLRHGQRHGLHEPVRLRVGSTGHQLCRDEEGL